MIALLGPQWQGGSANRINPRNCLVGRGEHLGLLGDHSSQHCLQELQRMVARTQVLTDRLENFEMLVVRVCHG